MSDIPLLPDVTTYVYADDIRFFAAAVDIHSLCERLQAYLSVLETWLDSVHLTLNVSKSALLVFPVAGPVSISLAYKNQVIPQVDSLKYLGVTYTSALDWHTHIKASVTKAKRAFGRMKRLCGKPAGMRRESGHTFAVVPILRPASHGVWARLVLQLPYLQTATVIPVGEAHSSILPWPPPVHLEPSFVLRGTRS